MTIEQLYDLYRQHPIITTDTRNCPAGSLFFALKGEKFNANQFADKAIEAGAAYAVINEKEYQKDSRFILVEDVLNTLQQLAAYHRRQLTIPIIGITGTNGKTTTKELTRAVLSTRFNTLATEGNLNNHIGVPLTLLKIRPEHEMAIIEMGASHPGEIEFLCRIARPDFGLITNVGKAHLEGFGSLEGVIRTKSELYQSLQLTHGKAFIHTENVYLKPADYGLETITYGTATDAFVSGNLISCSPYVKYQFTTNGESLTVNTHLIGSYNLTNMLAASAVGSYFGVSPEQIKAAIEQYEPSNKRSQLQQTAHNTLILDTYNANPTSMMAALKNFNQMNADNKTLLLGDMRELGSESRAEHQHILDYIIQSGFESVFLVGSEFNALSHPFKRFESSQQLHDWLIENPLTGRTILIKGSHSIALEKVIDAL